MDISFFEVKEQWEKDNIYEAFPKDNIQIFSETIEKVPIEKIKDSQIISTFIYSEVSSKLLSQLKKLKTVTTRSTGYNHIDLDYCKSHNISVANVPVYGENTVAEFTFGLLLDISRKISQSSQRVKSGSFDVSGLRGFDLTQKTIGIIGFGHIGQKFANMCHGFEMNILIFDTQLTPEKEKVIKQLHAKVVSLKELYQNSDIVSLHIPLLPQTQNFLDKKAFEQMKPGMVLLNTARGDLVNSHDLLLALQKGTISFAGLDVLQGEHAIVDELEMLCQEKTCPREKMKILLEDHMLINHPHVIVTPHNAFHTQDALERILTTTIQNIQCSKFNKKNSNFIV